MSGEGDGLVPAGGVPPGGWGGRGATPQVGPAATPGWAAPSSTPEGVGQAQLAASCVTAEGGLDLSPPRRRGPRAWLSIASGAAAVAGGVFSAVVWPGWAISVIFEQEALQSGVRTVLVEDYELTVTADMQ
ncbi:hypothetical protein Ae406Ps2_6178c [Pseudonocardia sp. Ae406_Ps2]|nr:hypothetical protein Ae406Ps2_6178c [Pseudonocardia sp. Ae406_Ps2]